MQSRLGEYMSPADEFCGGDTRAHHRQEHALTRTLKVQPTKESQASSAVLPLSVQPFPGGQKNTRPNDRIGGFRGQRASAGMEGAPWEAAYVERRYVHSLDSVQQQWFMPIKANYQGITRYQVPGMQSSAALHRRRQMYGLAGYGSVAADQLTMGMSGESTSIWQPWERQRASVAAAREAAALDVTELPPIPKTKRRKNTNKLPPIQQSHRQHALVEECS